MGQIRVNQFSAGWCPSDDSLNGRKNGLLHMGSCELDRNGAVQMCGGVQSISGIFNGGIVGIHSIFLNGTRTRYVVMQTGVSTDVYRNGLLIASFSQFVSRVGFSAAYNFIIIVAGSLRIKDNGTTVTLLGLNTPFQAPVPTTGPSGNLNGTYDYVQIGVRTDSNGYIAKSAPSPVRSLAVTNTSINITPLAPNQIDAQATEVWIFRRGGTLDRYYRIARVATNLIFNDNLSDKDAYTLGISLNANVLPVNLVGITGPILDVVGPVYGRHIYVTTSKLYFSEINSPDSTDPNVAISFAGNSTELFLWSKKVAENVVLIGTTVDVYLLTGTFVQLSDGFLDVYLKPMGVANPPIGIDVAVTSDAMAEKAGAVVYMSASGWVALSANGNLVLLSDERVDRLYRGNTAQAYGGVPIYLHPTLRYPCCIAKNKLWTAVPTITANNPTLPFGKRMEIYDFKRNYWRPLNMDPSILFAEQDGNVIGFFPDNVLRDIDNQFTKLNGNIFQAIDLMTVSFDDGSPNTRKDPVSLKIKAHTGDTNIFLTVYVDGITQVNLGSFATVSEVKDSYIDVFTIPPFKTIQFQISGLTQDFILNEITLDYLEHPPLQTTHKAKPNYGPHKKRARVWPIVMDLIGGSVEFFPIMDGFTIGNSTVFNGSGSVGKKTYYHHFLDDVFAVDYEAFIRSNNATIPFEVYEVGTPEFVEVLPVAKRFDQFGPFDMFKFGKIRKLRIRVIAFGTDVAANDVFVGHMLIDDIPSGNIDLIRLPEAKQVTVEYQPFKGLNGNMFRMTFGPAPYDMHIISVQVQTALSGRDTENTWLDIPRMDGK